MAAGIVGKAIAKKLGIPFGLIVQDLSGAGAKQSGLRGGTVISKIAYFVEDKALHGADALIVVSSTMRDVGVALGISAGHEVIDIFRSLKSNDGKLLQIDILTTLTKN